MPENRYYYSVPGAEMELWGSVIERMIFDYANFRWALLNGNALTARDKQDHKELTFAIFNEKGALSHILRGLMEDPSDTIKRVRAEVSNEQIQSGYVLGRKLREAWEPDVEDDEESPSR